MRAPFLRGGAVGRVRRKIVLPVGLVVGPVAGVVEGAKRERAAEISYLVRACGAFAHSAVS